MASYNKSVTSPQSNAARKLRDGPVRTAGQVSRRVASATRRVTSAKSKNTFRDNAIRNYGGEDLFLKTLILNDKK